MSYRMNKWCPALQTIWEDSPVELHELPMTSLQKELFELEVRQRDSEQPPSPYSDHYYFDARRKRDSFLDDYESFDGESSDEEEEEVFTYPSDDDEDLEDYDYSPHPLAIQQSVRWVKAKSFLISDRLYSTNDGAWLRLSKRLENS